MRQNISLLEKVLEVYPLRFVDMVEDGENVWFSAYEFNGLFKCNLGDGTVGYMGMFPEMEGDQYWLYSTVALYKNQLFFCPLCSDNIAVYDIKDSHFEYYQIASNGTKKSYFLGMGQYGESLFFWNGVVPEVICFNMAKKTYEEVKGDAADSCIKLGRDFCIVDNMLYVVSAGQKGAWQIDMRMKEKKFYSFNEKGDIFTISYDGVIFWLTDDKNQMIEWIPNKKMVRHEIDKKIPLKSARMSDFLDHTIYYALIETDDILAFHTDYNTFKVIETEKKGEKYQGRTEYLLGNLMIKTVKDKVWIFNNTYSSLQAIHGEEINSRELIVTNNVKQFLKDRCDIFFQKKFIGEERQLFYQRERSDRMIRLETYQYIISKDENTHNNWGISDYGARIYYKIKELLH